MLQRLKQTVMTALSAVALYTGAMAQDAKPERSPVKTETRIYAETRQDAAVQSLVSYEGQKAFTQVEKDATTVGTDFNYANFRLNAGWRDTLTEDFGKAYLSYNTKSGSLGLEYAVLDQAKDLDKIIWFGSVKLDDAFGLEAALDTEGNKAGVLTFEKDGHTVYVGGHLNEDNKDWEANASYSTELFGAGLWSYVRVGDDDFLDARVALGSRQWRQRAKVFGVDDDDFNTLSKLGDATFPLFFKNFSLSDAESYVNNETGEYGIDLRYVYDKRASARGALNVGDYAFLHDVTPIAEYRRDFANDTNHIIAGMRVALADSGLRIWYHEHIDEDVRGKWDNSHAVMLEWKKEF